MDLKLFHRLKNKVTQKGPAILADNMMMLIMFKYGIYWNPTFTTQEHSEEFFLNKGLDILVDFEDIVQPWYDNHITCYDMWQVNEEALLKHLYILKREFCEISDEEDVKTDFLFHCALMFHLALDYYNKGVESALTIVFLEVYSLACYYSERMNFKCDLVTTTA